MIGILNLKLSVMKKTGYILLVLAFFLAITSCEMQSEYSDVDQSAIVPSVETVDFGTVTVGDTVVKKMSVGFYQFLDGKNINAVYSIPESSNFSIDSMYNRIPEMTGKAYSIEYIDIQCKTEAADTFNTTMTVTAADRIRSVSLTAIVKIE